MEEGHLGNKGNTSYERPDGAMRRSCLREDVCEGIAHHVAQLTFGATTTIHPLSENRASQELELKNDLQCVRTSDIALRGDQETSYRTER